MDLQIRLDSHRIRSAEACLKTKGGQGRLGSDQRICRGSKSYEGIENGNGLVQVVAGIWMIGNVGSSVG